MTNDDEPTKDDLERRVEQLEQTVQRMMPNRRQALTGLGLLAGGGLLGGSASGSTGSAGNVGTDSDRPDVFADSVDANSVSTDHADLNANTTVEELAKVGEEGSLRGSQIFTLSDGGTQKLSNDFQTVRCGFFMVRNRDDSDTAIVAQAASNLSLVDSNGSWALSDSDGNNCVFLGADNALVIKNRTGGSKGYTASSLIQN